MAGAVCLRAQALVATPCFSTLLPYNHPSRRGQRQPPQASASAGSGVIISREAEDEASSSSSEVSQDSGSGRR